MEESKAAELGSWNLVLSDKVGCEQGRNRKLEHRSTAEMERFAEVAEEPDVHLGESEVNVVQQRELLKVFG